MVMMSNAPEVRNVERAAGDPPLQIVPDLSDIGPFIINLRASTAPMTVAQMECATVQRAQVYQIKRLEDGRARYRLRLGPFASADDVEAILEKVRGEYPGALSVTAGLEDLQAIAALKMSLKPANGASKTPKDLATATPRTKPTMAANPKPVASVAPVVQTAPRIISTTPIAKAAPAASAALIARVTPTRSTAPAVKAVPAASAAPIVRAPPTTARTPVANTAPSVGTASVAKAPSVARTVPAPRVNSEPVLESTQTLRPLTTLELDVTEASPRWFVIQLSVSQTAFDPDALPSLDIFTLYRLYSVSVSHEGRVVHSLRLGFFGEDMAARAVANYLAAFFDNPTIKRVSVAERERFAEQGVEARKDVGQTGRHATIEITDALVIRELRRAR